VAVKGLMGIEIRRIKSDGFVALPVGDLLAHQRQECLLERAVVARRPCFALRGLIGSTGWSGLVGLSGLGEGLKVKPCRGREHQDYKPGFRRQRLC
jgi:hypothetical protein